MNCKVGLISFPISQDKLYFINLGQVRNKKDTNMLFQLHTELSYLSDFKMFITEDQTHHIDNLEEIIFFQNKYKLTKKIHFNLSPQCTSIKYSRPELYDIDCMVPLFQEKPEKPIMTLNNSCIDRIFILMPFPSPISRGKIIDNCINTSTNINASFVIVGDKTKLTKRYLLSCNIPSSNITTIKFSGLPDCIAESIMIIQTMYIEPEIFICTPTMTVGNILKNVRLLRLNMAIDKTTRVKFIVDN